MYSPQIFFSYVLYFHQPSFKITKDQTFPSQWNIRQSTIMIQLNPLDKMNYSYKEKKKYKVLIINRNWAFLYVRSSLFKYFFVPSGREFPRIVVYYGLLYF